MKMELLSAFFFFFLCFVLPSSGLNSDGLLLMNFKSSVLVDPLSQLQTWNYNHETPCSWRGVSCNNDSKVVNLSLPNSQLLGSIHSDLGSLHSLQILDLSNNSFNGPLPVSFFNGTELRSLDLSGNMISGEVPSSIGDLHSLQTLNLSDNALAGKLPANLVTLGNLTAVSLQSNYFSGEIPGGWRDVQFLDLSSNLINGSLPPDFGGASLRYLNVSFNQISGNIPPEIGDTFPRNATVDLSFNNLTGSIPVFLNQKSYFFTGNPGLCGDPAPNPCPISSSPMSTPAIAAIPNTISSNPVTNPTTQQTNRTPRTGLRPGVITGIVIGDIAGIGILAVIFLYIYRRKKSKDIANSNSNDKQREETTDTITLSPSSSSSSSSSPDESRRFTKWSCLRKEPETTPSDEEESRYNADQRSGDSEGTLVTVDGEKEMEIETLLKASAYILGAKGSSIMYKAVLEDGTVYAVRRLGETGLTQRRFKDFESNIRAIGKLVHPNLVRLRGFYWSTDEKLVIYDFVPNGSLVNPRYRKGGGSASPYHLPWETRLKIAKGIARGLAYLHEKKHVHGNLKPSSILLGHDMEPRIGDLGLERLLTGETSYSRAGGSSSRIFGSKRSRASSRDFSSIGPTPSPSPSSLGPLSPYCAPESFRSLKPSPKWDVFGFGMILLELLTGKIVSGEEIGLGNGLTVEDGHHALRMVDVTIRGELHGKEDFLLGCLKLGYNCASPVPQKRPTMKESLAVLERFSPDSSVVKFPSFHYMNH
ncbi:putative LRR receptor-like serine/threonine-protein kinase [Raphanus sativus]|uniref:Probable LRR receptor-like serine/threonine-protein kinase At4g37250 n=1 Tax=Raphanus sativus TaxID=3726 RepID=A0A9W3D7N9_RAPSA|nr:probable LRR receptor-like serine/threonine-protein kinase At4g37250 [Raphanus sativus]KAJ4914150.1 putative LRR receptor-like serine/threonine-protein kinase [Raphanus sativus]